MVGTAVGNVEFALAAQGLNDPEYHLYSELHECFGSMAGEWVTETGGKVEPGLELSRDPHHDAPNSKHPSGAVFYPRSGTLAKPAANSRLPG